VLKPELIRSLPEIAGPVLTAYLDTDRAKQSNRWPKPGYQARFESQAKAILATIPANERSLFQNQLERIAAYLQSHTLRCRGMVIFAGPAAWQAVPLQLAVEDELHWGVPALAQLLWLLDEHKPCGIVVAGRKRVRFFLYWLGEILALEEKGFRLEVSKKKEMGPVSRPGVRMSHGTNRDVFDHHVAAQYARYHRQIAEGIEHWCSIEPLESVFLIGLDEMVKAIRKELPQTVSKKTVLVAADLGWVSRAELRKRIEPFVADYVRERETALVDAMLGDGRSAIIGIDEALSGLQQGKIRGLVIAKGLDASLQQCVRCSWVDGTADPVCPACGGDRRHIRLRDVLPELVRRYSVTLDVVSAEAGRKLEVAGGMGALLREFERKEYGQHAVFA
jgi:hypothetical protein